MNRFSMRATALALALSILCSSAALADIDVVKRAQSDFHDYPMTSTNNARVKTARVAIVNYDLIGRDFAQMARGADENDQAWHDRVDAWVLNQTAFVLDKQAAQSATNSDIQTTGENKLALRPKGYGRAHIIPVEGGMMDAKGVGSYAPKLGGHSDGLATLGEMIREYIYEKAVAMVLKHAGGKINTVGNYGVVYYGFNVKHEDGSQSPAGYVLRQAHQRAPGFNSTLSRENGIAIEKLLRRYGVTSSGETFTCREGTHKARCMFDYTNVQGTDNASTVEVLDFGAFLAVDHFDQNLVSNYDPGTPISEPGQADFIQPDKALRIPLEQWGAYANHQDPKMDKPFVWSHELATAFAEGRADRSAMETHLRNMLGPIAARLGAGR